MIEIENNEPVNLTATTASKGSFLPLDILRKLPKAELHQHLDGSINVSTIIELAKEQNIELPSYDPEVLSTYVLKDKDCNGLVHFLEAFSITLKVMQKPYAITRVFYEVCENLVKDGVSYVEIRFSPILHVEQGLSLSEVMNAVCDGLALAEFKLPIKARIIVCGLRHLSPNVTKDLAEIAWRYRHKGVAGFDLAGPEDGFSSKYHKQAFDIVRDKALNCTIHSGEDSNYMSVFDSIICGAHRIGHGIAVQQNQDLLNHMINRRIPIECCLTSNLQIKALKHYKDHPIRKYFDQNAIVTLCCDNPTMSNITLSGEFSVAIENFDFNIEEVLRLIDYSFASAFIEAPMKSTLRKEAVIKSIRIFKEHGYDLDPIVKNKNYYFHETGIDIIHELSVIEKINSQFTLGKCLSPIHSPVTMEFLKAMPKADLQSRFDGSVSLSTCWNELQLIKDDKDFKKLFPINIDTFTSFDKFRETIQNPNHSTGSIALSKDIMNALLQNEGQLERGFDDIIKTAIDDNVKYIEIAFRPTSHTKINLTKEQVLNIIIEKKNEWENTGKIKIGLILFSSSVSDDPIECLSNAKVAIQNKSNGIVGFGIFGTETISPSEIKHFSQTFDLLKRHHFNLVQNSGTSDIGSLVSTIHQAGAARLSGAFQLHKYPRLMSYVGNYRIPVEISLTKKLKSFTKDLSFTTPIRHLLDNNVPVIICSFRSSLYSFGRTEMLYEIVKNAQLDLEHVVRLFKNPFSFNFQNLQERTKLVNLFNETSIQVLQNHKITSQNLIIN
ncbi:hypothetical protein CYY_005192 [Polysphondylium violaceum]|uniref:adenosine deaminase n=1 Tax=Polysphondylium violaceum TaxID=133409 RepID=A0A8J4UZS7_9MYCE|nr:hypothetical protein CYY_005192 [Polysphondylium violaceum]